jgi:hypothetical protein
VDALKVISSIISTYEHTLYLCLRVYMLTDMCVGIINISNTMHIMPCQYVCTYVYVFVIVYVRYVGPILHSRFS